MPEHQTTHTLALSSEPHPPLVSRPRMGIWRVFVAAVLVAWLALVTGFEYWPDVARRWPMTALMVLGSLVAGSTPMGGGAVSFPYLVLALGESTASARNFGLLIQALGMTSAMIFIFCRRTPVDRRMLIWTCTGAALGIAAGTAWIAPRVPAGIVKLLFSCLWMSFAVLTLAKAREICSFDQAKPAQAGAPARTGLAVGLLGGVIASMIGLGVEMVLYTVLVLLYRTDLKVAVPSAVSAMAVTSIFGAGIQAAAGGLDREVFLRFLAAAPVVIFGAPVGAYLVGVIPRIRTLYFVSALCVLQFIWTLLRVLPTGWEWLFVGVAMAASIQGFVLLYRRGRALSAGQ